MHGVNVMVYERHFRRKALNQKATSIEIMCI